MILIIGGMGSGKRTYVKEALGYKEEQMADAVSDEKPILFNLQNLIKERLSETAPNSENDFIDFLLNKEIICCNEVGAGIIPLAPEDRRWREETGRICILLAENAEKVIRMTCGIPQIIKG